MGDSAYATRPAQAQDRASFRQQGSAPARYPSDDRYDHIHSVFGPPKANAAPAKSDKPTASDAHTKSNQASSDADQMSLELFARTMLDAAAAVELALNNDPGDAGGALQYSQISRQFWSVYSAADGAESNNKGSTALLDDQHKGLLLSDVRAINAAYVVFAAAMDKANAWAHENGWDQGKNPMNPDWVHQWIEAIYDEFGIKKGDVGSDNAEALDPADKLRDRTITENLTAALAAADSMKAGNKEDARRLRDHVLTALTELRHLGSKARAKYKHDVEALAEATKGLDEDHWHFREPVDDLMAVYR